MSKFMGLLKNEYIKQLKKKSTLFIFILVGVFAFGLAGLVKLTMLIDTNLDDLKATFTSYDYSDDIDTAKENGEEKLTEYYEYLQENRINRTNWKRGLAGVMFEQSFDKSDIT